MRTELPHRVRAAVRARSVDVMLCLVRAQARGGALYAYDGVTVTLSDVQISGCTASATGSSNSDVSAALRRLPRTCRSPLAAREPIFPPGAHAP